MCPWLLVCVDTIRLGMVRNRGKISYSQQVVLESPVELIVNGNLGVSEVAVSWKYTSDCVASRFIVTVYNRTLSPIIANIETAAHQTTVTGFPICVPLVIGVRGCNDVGDGVEARKEFSISRDYPKYWNSCTSSALTNFSIGVSLAIDVRGRNDIGDASVNRPAPPQILSLEANRGKRIATVS
ncbi:hypothetical protein T265_02412 [Opisthorchis viverrini]|uniref:Uncharacterized protein n=1 Tax=Opisthorchis viverrini TaxID=6198 RepID=A0A074ZV68_OPIVI|nr:hypothetical protein T265_02412 [Opisthorchis viverrini]KER31363.1 hypothetical protein T265_02412 [Opisthorchis viverrini]